MEQIAKVIHCDACFMAMLYKRPSAQSSTLRVYWKPCACGPLEWTRVCFPHWSGLVVQLWIHSRESLSVLGLRSNELRPTIWGDLRRLPSKLWCVYRRMNRRPLTQTSYRKYMFLLDFTSHCCWTSSAFFISMQVVGQRAQSIWSDPACS